MAWRNLSFLVVTWRGREVVEDCVRAMLETLDELAEVDGWTGQVVVVDNASHGRTAEVLGRLAEDVRVTLIANRVDLGFAGGNNQAFRASTGRTVAMVSPEVMIDALGVRAAVEHLEQHPEAGLVTCRLSGPDGAPQSIHRSLPTLAATLATQTSVGHVIDRRLLGGRLGRALDLRDLPPSGYAPIGQAARGLIVFRRTLVSCLGGYLFDETIPLYFSDADLSRRAHDAGFEVHLLLDTWVRQLQALSLGEVDAAAGNVELWRGALAYYGEHHPRWQRSLLARIAPGEARLAPAARVAPGLSCDRPLVSIAIPAYNYARFLPDAIESALNQRYERVEVVVVDDGSTDDTPQVAQAFGNRIRYDRTSNRGLSAARNHGARLASGELIVFLDADNRLDRSFVLETVTALQADPCAAFAYTQLRHFGDRAFETQKPPWDPERLRDGNYIDACALVYSDLVRRFPFDEANRVGWEDWDFWLTLAEHGYRGTLVDKPLVAYRRHGEAMTGRITGVVRLDLRASVLRRHRGYVGWERWWRAETRRLRQRLGTARRHVSRSVGRPNQITAEPIGGCGDRASPGTTPQA